MSDHGNRLEAAEPPASRRATYLRGRCMFCRTRKATLHFGDMLSLTHGGGLNCCELCCAEKQLAHARERAALIPELEAKVAALTQTALPSPKPEAARLSDRQTGEAAERAEVCPRCHGVSPFAEGVSELRKRCTPLTCDAWTFTARLTKQGPKPIRRDGRADLRAIGGGAGTDTPGDET